MSSPISPRGPRFTPSYGQLRAAMATGVTRHEVCTACGVTFSVGGKELRALLRKYGRRAAIPKTCKLHRGPQAEGVPDAIDTVGLEE